jgi:hypothetical protein
MNLPERPCGCFAQIHPDTFFREPANRTVLAATEGA